MAIAGRSCAGSATAMRRAARGPARYHTKPCGGRFSMPIIVRCQTCGRLLKAPDEAAGRRAECPFCGKSVEVKGAQFTQAAAAVSTSPEQPAQETSAAEPTAFEHFLDPPKSDPSAVP